MGKTRKETLEQNRNWLAWRAAVAQGKGWRMAFSMINGTTRRGVIVSTEIDKTFKSDPKDQGRTKSSLTMVLDTGDRVALTQCNGMERLL